LQSQPQLQGQYNFENSNTNFNSNYNKNNSNQYPYKGYQNHNQPNIPLNNNTEFINNFNPNRYISQGPLDNYKNVISEKTTPADKIFSNYFFNHPDKTGQGFNNRENKTPFSSNIVQDDNDFIK
jgi:hypothetical protein